jgi:hypothetical protein
MRLQGVSVAIVRGAWESHVHGEGPPLARWGRRHPPEGADGEYRSMSGEHAGPQIPRRRRPSAVNAARMVPPRGMEKRAIRNRALSLPTLADADGALRTVNPLRRPPCAVNVAGTVPPGGMESRVSGYRALSLPTGCASCPYPLEYCIGGTWGIPLLHCSLGPKAANFWT